MFTLFKRKNVFVLLFMACIAVFMLTACNDDFDPGGTNTPPPAGTGDIEYKPGVGMQISWNTVANTSFYDIYHAGSRFGTYTYIDTVSAGSGKISFLHSVSHPDKAPNLNRFENYYRVEAHDADGDIITSLLMSLELSIFGQTVLFFDAKYDDMTAIRTEINRIHDQEMFGQVLQGDGRNGEFSSRRYTFFFKPGEYHIDGTLYIGFYTHIAGLGRLPSDTRLRASIDTPPHLASNNATCTFWRSIENLELFGAGRQFRWGVSQSAPMRRMLVRIPTAYHYMSGSCSGGYTGDSWFSAGVDGGSQQQWYTRNSHYTNQMGGVVWNNVIQASTGNIPPTSATGAQTTIPDSPIIREKPFLFIDDDGEYKVFKPAIRTNAVGISWDDGSGSPGMNTGAENDGMGSGTIIDFLSNFYVTRTEVRQIGMTWHAVGLDSADTINAQLNAGKHIYFTPARYEINTPIVVSKPDTIVLGNGFPTLYPSASNTNGSLFVEDVPGVTVAGLMFDAAPSPGNTFPVYQLAVGHTGAQNSAAQNSNNPILLADLCLRIGGYYSQPVHADISVLINSNNVIGDKLWVWRGDHGLGSWIDWHVNTSINGVVVFGNDVSMYGLFVEHYHQYNTLWIGERGRTYFYQNETPYDPHRQVHYISRLGQLGPGGETNGWAQYKVHHAVTDHVAWGLGMYCVFLDRANATKERILLANAAEVPHKPGVIIHKAIIVFIGSGNRGGIESIVNGMGNSVLDGFGTQRLTRFENGTAIHGAINLGVGVEPQPEDHWVEKLSISNSGVVTANPEGGPPWFFAGFGDYTP
jgi:hypothetical protein